MGARCPRCRSHRIAFYYYAPVIVTQGEGQKVEEVRVVDEEVAPADKAECDACGHAFRTSREPAGEWPPWSLGV